VIDVAIARFEHEQEMKRALATVTDALRERDVVDRAKALLMRKHRLAEPQAYARLRTTAMNQSITIAELARRLLALADLFD